MDPRRDKDKLEDRFDGEMYDRSYEPDRSSHQQRWTGDPWTDKKTGAKVIPTSGYLLGPNILGRFGTHTNIVENNRNQPSDDYRKTGSHELYHADGMSEDEVRRANKEQPANYR